MEDIEKIRRLVSLVSDNKLAELELEEPDFRVKIKNRGAIQYWPAASPPSSGQGHPQWGPPPSDYPPGEEPDTSGTETREDKNLVEIVSPMVGTFYRASGENAEPYVTVGDTLEPDTVVCIVEAMKVMNEVKAEVNGVIEEILIQDGEPVEYNQELFLVRLREEPSAE